MRHFMVVAGLSAVLLVGFGLGTGIVVSACSPGDSVEKGCHSDDDCPRPDRQICELETGVCVGFTSKPGQVDGGDQEGIDAGTGDAAP